MSRRRETGNAMCWTKDNSSYALPPEDYPRLKQEWMAGRAFYEGRSFHGCPIVIKLSMVESIQLFTPESIAAQFAEDDADRGDDMLIGTT